MHTHGVSFGIPSLPSWECGLKLEEVKQEICDEYVAPFVGVWIEICRDDAGYFYVTVAPFVGVWIEIRYRCCSCDRFSVAPFVGVWIEISELSLLLYFQ